MAAEPTPVPNPIVAEDLPNGDKVLKPSVGADVTVGLSWEFFEGAAKVDLDAAAVCFDELGMVMDAVYYNQLRAMQGAMTHSGDNRDGAAEGMDESIELDLNRLPLNAKVIVLVVTCHSGGTFKDVESAYANVTDSKTKAVLAESTVLASGMTNNTAVVLGAIYRNSDNNAWYLRNLGTPAHGFTFYDCLEAIREVADSLLDEGMKYERVLTSEKVFDMKKGDVGVLAPGTKSVAIGLGWTVSGSLDLDASAVMLGGYMSNGSRRHLQDVYYSRLKSSDGSVVHSGDNTTGAGDGDDEVINVRLDIVPSEVEEIVFVVNIFTNGGTFNRCRDSYINLRSDTDHDASDGRVLAHFVINGNINTRGMVFAKLYRLGNGSWGFKGMGVGCGGKRVTDKECQDVVTEKAPGTDLQLTPAPRGRGGGASGGGGSGAGQGGCCVVS